MFRNGISLGRRQLILSTTRPAVQHELPFVCHACTVRGLAGAVSLKPAKAAEKKKKPKQDTFIDQIRRLEEHVQQMERSYTDKLKTKMAEESIPAGEITDDMQDEAYAALMAPTSEADMFLPKPTVLLDEVSDRVRTRLGGVHALQLLEVTEPDWGAILSALDSGKGLKGLRASDVNSVIRCMDYESRANLQTRVFEAMNAVKMEPNSYTYDMFMLAHNKVKNPDEVRRLFEEMQEREITPTIYSYGHIVNAYSEQADVAAAAKAFKDMQTANLEPNIVVYTSLIKAFVRNEDYETTWQVFNLLKYKSKATAPDEITYSLMLHVCAETGACEKAEELWRELLTHVEKPQADTFRNIIHACAVRKHYFTQAWKYASDMTTAGYPLDRETLNILITACARKGELTRARLLIRHMMDSSSPAMQPDKFTYQNFLRCYASYQPPLSPDRRSKMKHHSQIIAPGADFTISDAPFLLPENRLVKRSAEDAEHIEIPFLPKAVLQTWREVLDEAALVVNWIRDHYPDIVDTQFMNSYLFICMAQRGASNVADLKWSYRNDFKNPASCADPEPEVIDPLLDDFPRVERNIYTYDVALEAAHKFRKLDFAREVWMDRLRYMQSPECAAIKPAIRQRMDRNAQLNMINCLAGCDHLPEARQAVEMLSEKGVQFEWEDLRTLYTKAVQAEDPETLMMIKNHTSPKEGSKEEFKVLMAEDLKGVNVKPARTRRR